MRDKDRKIMAARTIPIRNGAIFQPTRISTRKVHEPRDEQVRIPKSPQRKRASPGNTSQPRSRAAEKELAGHTAREVVDDAPNPPEIIDVAAPHDHLSRVPLSQRRSAKRVASPSTTSEMSLGILDYYLNAPSPTPSPTLAAAIPHIQTQLMDPAMDKFNFDFVPATPARQPPSDLEKTKARPLECNTEAGAERISDNLLDSSPLIHLTQSTPIKDAYTLFPSSKAPKQARALEPGETKPSSNPISIPKRPKPLTSSNQQPSASYRPRKESTSSSVRSRKDSFTSFSGTNRIPMKILLSSDRGPTTSGSTSSSTASPPHHESRWSQDTITSPQTVTTPGPRTSFGSLLGDSARYPACFFEDDDCDDDDFGCEGAPLTKRFRWQRRRSVVKEVKAKKAAQFDGGKRGFGSRFVGFLLCGCCDDEG